MTSTTRIVARGQPGRATCDLSPGLVAARVLRPGPGDLHLGLLATSATLLGGDAVRIAVEVGPGLRLDLRDIAGTLAQHGRGRPARWDVDLALGAGATLVWHGAPFVISRGAQVHRSTRAHLGEGARLLLRETLGLGRSGQVSGDLRARTEIGDDEGPVLVEDLDLDGVTRARAGVVGDARCLDSVLAIGWRPPTEPTAMILARPGALHREVLAHAHLSGCEATMAAWAADLDRRE